jgi:hypothetical protein
MENPIDRLGLSPLATADEITAALRERAEDASDDERRALRATWEELTHHPRSRHRAALTTFPERAELRARPPELPELLRPMRPRGEPDGLDVEPLDLLPRPSVGAALAGKLPPPPPALASLESDRILARSAHDGRGGALGRGVRGDEVVPASKKSQS